jgi:hypothetical protein
MNREAVIWSLRDAKRAHKKWVSHALAIIEGIPIEKNQVPINSTECVFGKWYYGSGQSLHHIAGYSEIEPLHDDLHQIYMQIFALLFTKKASFFEKLFGKTHTVSEEELELARVKFSKLNDTSHKLLEKIEILEVRLEQMTDTAFNHVMQNDKQGAAKRETV